MKPAVIVIVLLSGTIGPPVSAEVDQYDFDLIRRTPRTTDAEVDAGVKAATKACDPDDRLSYGSRTFMNCMRAKGYKFVRVEHKKSPPPSDPYFSSNAKAPPGHFIDHDTGTDCVSEGWGDVCDPPNGTVHYFDPDQNLPCTRTVAIAICSNM